MRRSSLCVALLVAVITGSFAGCASQRGGTFANSNMSRKEVQFYKAGLAESGNHLERARMMYEQLYTQDRSNYLVCHRLAGVHARQGNYDAAIRYLKEAHRLNSRNSEILNDLGYTCYLGGDLAGAQEALQAALQIDPQNPRVNSNLAMVMNSLPRPVEDQQQQQQQYASSNFPHPLPVLTDTPAEPAEVAAPIADVANTVASENTAVPANTVATATPVDTASAVAATPIVVTPLPASSQPASSPAASPMIVAAPSIKGSAPVKAVAKEVPAVIPAAAQQDPELRPLVLRSDSVSDKPKIPSEVVSAPVITPARGTTLANIPDSISPRAIVAGDYVRLCANADADVKSLLTSMNSQRPDPMKSAILQLGVMGDQAQSALPAIRFTLNHSNAYIRIHSALALWRIEQNAEDTIPVFVSGLRDTNADVRAFAAAALEMGPRDSELITPLTGALSDVSPFVRLHAAAALYQFPQQQTTAAYVIVSHLTDKEANARWLATFLLGEILPRTEITVQALTKSLQDSDSRIRIAAAFALRGLGSDAKAALPELKKLATDRQPEVRKAAEEAARDIEQQTVAKI